MTALTEVEPSSPIVLHNAVDLCPTSNHCRNPKRPTFWLSGAFHRDADHILLPVIQAMEILASEWKDDPPLLKVAGYFDRNAQQSPWFESVVKNITKLKNLGMCVWVGKYTPNQLPALMQDVTLALHLTNKDACPNSVLERMALGVGHVYANSGGTPELVGDSGISIESAESWESQIPVQVDELVEALKVGVSIWEKLGQMSLERVIANFTYQKYIDRHRDIFNKVRNDFLA
jgi:glycosyltransferase involved in cell wall biosynthesis